MTQDTAKAAKSPSPVQVAWWVALAHQPDQLFAMADGLLTAITKANEAAYVASGKISTAENNRHSVKMAAVERLMKPAAEGEKGMARTVAEGLASTDEQYRNYLNHLADLQVQLERHRHDADVARLRFRLVEAALRRALDEAGNVTVAEAPASKEKK